MQVLNNSAVPVLGPVFGTLLCHFGAGLGHQEGPCDGIVALEVGGAEQVGLEVPVSRAVVTPELLIVVYFGGIRAFANSRRVPVVL